MKVKVRNIALCILSVLFLSCNNNGGKKFNPQGREQVFTSDADRQEAIAKKRAELDSLNIDTEKLVFENNIKLTVLPPAPNGDLTLSASKAMAAKMLQITAQNGVGGYGNSPAFAFAAAFTPTGRATTGTVPQRMVSKYTITFVVGNMLTGDVYATYETDVEGVGATFEEATVNAVDQVKNDNGLQQMLKTASERIMSWYNQNPQGFKAVVEEFVANQDYATAYALLATVPKEASVCYEYATKRQGQVLDEMKMQKAEELLSELKNAIASAGEHYNRMVAGCLKMIPANSKQYAEAEKLYDEYVKHIQDVRIDSIKHEQKIELERLAIEQLKLKYEQEASMKVAEKALTPPKGIEASEEETSSGGIIGSFKKHPFLWGLGAGAVLAGGAAVAVYSGLPLIGKLALAFLL
jgi:hypothetical protein